MGKMKIENRLLSKCGKIENEIMDFDVGLFFRCLLLFDTFILDSIRLKEFSHIVNLIGYYQTIDLLKYRNFKIRCTALSVGSVGQTAVLGRTKETILPFGSYAFAVVKIAFRKKYISDCLKSIEDIPSVSFKQKKKLKKSIASIIIDEVPDIGESALQQMNADISQNIPAIKAALLIHLKKEHGINPPPEKLNIKIVPKNEKEFVSEHNLNQSFGLNDHQSHKAIEQALLAIGGLNQRISEMKAFETLSGFKVQEVPLFENKLAFLFDKISPDKKIDQFDRVVELAGIPSLDQIGKEYKLNLDKFLKIREGKECTEFRAWLSEATNYTDQEISERVESFRAKIGALVGGKIGKTIRFLTATVAGLLDGGAVTGPALGGIDTFVLDKIFPSKGPITFINNIYPSIFEKTSIEESNKALSDGRA